jgi:hypothetical protein
MVIGYAVSILLGTALKLVRGESPPGMALAGSFYEHHHRFLKYFSQYSKIKSKKLDNVLEEC